MNQNKTYPYDISVIVPVYNVSEFLPACLDSIVNQTKDKLEVIMIDDGSTDDSGEIADRYARRHDNFFVYHIENGGLGHGRNLGVEKSHGKYICFIDSDDIVTPDAYERMFCAAERNGSDMAIFAVERFNSSKEWSSGIHIRAFRNAKPVTHIRENSDLIYDTISCNKLIRRDFWDKHGFQFPERILYEDIPVTIPMHYLANHVSVIQSIGYLWRVRDQASKSITQKTGSLRNLEDRIKILNMLNKFFDENVKEKELVIEKDLKSLRVDLLIFVKECASVPREQAEIIMKLVRDYICESICKEAFERLTYIEQYIYKCVIEDDFDSLYEAILYRIKALEKLAITEENGRFYASVPEEIYKKSKVDYTNELKVREAKSYITQITAEDGVIRLSSYLFIPRLNIREGEQEIEAYLLNEFTGEETPLRVEYTKNTSLTAEQGVIFNRVSGEKAEYCYDGTGFDVVIDAGMLTANDSRAQLILLKYKNRLTEGVTVLHNMRAAHLDWTKELATLGGNTIVHLDTGAYRTPLVYVDSVNAFLEAFENDGSSLLFRISTENGEMLCVNTENKKDNFTLDIKEHFVTIPVEKLSDGSEYEFYVKDGRISRLVREGKNTNLIHTENFGAIIRSNKTHIVRIRKAQAFSCLRHPEIDENNSIRFGTTNIGKIDLAYNRAQIVIFDEILGRYNTIARAKTRVGDDNRLRANFRIDLNNDEITKNMYQSRRDVFIEYLKTDEKGKKVFGSERQILVSSKHFKINAELDTLKVTFYRAMDSKARLNLEQKWSEEENSFDKRKALMDKYYPEYRKEPLNNKMIVFESMWGCKFSCNPRAIYEYMQKYHPDYECVWIFEDERTPINGDGRRVRRGSLEYYKVLAEAKYLVNNVNFEDDYIKRDGQIEIQTMHGTPLKTLGFDVADEFPTIEDQKRLECRVARWNYLVVQGEFMKSKAYQIYHFDGNILETGYPRTDGLYKEADIDDIKSRLGIPKDKKVILYAPTWRVKNSFDMALNLEKMREELGDEYVLLIRIHYFASSGYTVPADNKFIFNMNDYANAENLYKISDIMITDYSSIMFDYALLDKPLIFFAYDLKSYASSTRGVYFDIRTEAPGPIVYTTDELIDTVKNLDSEMDKVKDRAQAFKDKYLTYECPNSSEKVVKEVIKPSRFVSSFYRMKRTFKNLINKIR